MLRLHEVHQVLGRKTKREKYTINISCIFNERRNGENKMGMNYWKLTFFLEYLAILTIFELCLQYYPFSKYRKITVR